MELTPQALHDVEFREARRGGYNTRDVDDFLERVAIGVGQLQDRLREAYHRAEAAEARMGDIQRQLEDLQRRGPVAEPQPQMHQPPQPQPQPHQGASETDETLRRTLVLAQRTADATIKEAQEEAGRLLREAETHADQVRASAETDALRDARHEVEELAESRETLIADLEKLERHLDEQRTQIRAGLDELQRLVEEPTALRMDPAPPVSDVALPRRGGSSSMPAELSGNGSFASNGNSGGLADIDPYQPVTEQLPSVDAPAASALSSLPGDDLDRGLPPQHDPSVVAALQELHGTEAPSPNRPPLESRQPAENLGSFEAPTPFSSRPPLESRQPADGLGSFEAPTPFDSRPPSEPHEPSEGSSVFDTPPPFESRPPLESRQPAEGLGGLGSFESRPPLESRPPGEPRSPFESLPSLDPPSESRPLFEARPPLESRPPFESRPPLESRSPMESLSSEDTGRPPLEPREPLDARQPLPQRGAFQADQPQAPAAPPGGGTGFLPDLRAAFDPPPEIPDQQPTQPIEDLAPIDAPPPPPPPFDGLREVGGIPIEPGSRPSAWGRGIFDTDDEEEPRYGHR